MKENNIFEWDITDHDTTKLTTFIQNRITKNEQNK